MSFLTNLRYGSITSCPLMIAIKRGLTLLIPFMIMGSFAIFINNLPIPWYQDTMLRIFGDSWRSFGSYIHQGSFAIMAVGMLLTISYSLAELSPLARTYEVNPIIAGIVSLGCLFAIMPVDNRLLNLDWLGPLGVFLANTVAGNSVCLILLL